MAVGDWEPARPVDTKAMAASYPGVVCGRTCNDITRLGGGGTRLRKEWPVPDSRIGLIGAARTTTDVVTQTRRCSRCETWKPLADFTRNAADGAGHSFCCRVCKKRIDHTRRQTEQRQVVATMSAAARSRSVVVARQPLHAGWDAARRDAD